MRQTTLFGNDYTVEHWGAPGSPAIHFFHANGFCAGLYAPFLSPLFQEFDIYALEIPGHGRSGWTGLIHHWEDLTDYLIDYLDRLECEKPLIGMGHSIGGVVSLMAAVRRPELFKKLVLLDPILLPPRLTFMLRLANFLHFRYTTPIIAKAERRRRYFPSRTAAREHYARKNAFQHWQSGFLDAYIACGFKPAAEKGVELCCSPQLEASIYRAIPTTVWRYARRLTIPTLVLGGEQSDALLPAARKRLEKLNPRITIRTIPGSHLFPFEYPAQALRQIREFIP